MMVSVCHQTPQLFLIQCRKVSLATRCRFLQHRLPKIYMKCKCSAILKSLLRNLVNFLKDPSSSYSVDGPADIPADGPADAGLADTPADGPANTPADAGPADFQQMQVQRILQQMQVQWMVQPADAGPADIPADGPANTPADAGPADVPADGPVADGPANTPADGYSSGWSSICGIAVTRKQQIL